MYIGIIKRVGVRFSISLYIVRALFYPTGVICLVEFNTRNALNTVMNLINGHCSLKKKKICDMCCI